MGWEFRDGVRGRHSVRYWGTCSVMGGLCGERYYKYRARGRVRVKVRACGKINRNTTGGPCTDITGRKFTDTVTVTITLTVPVRLLYTVTYRGYSTVYCNIQRLFYCIL